MDKVLDEGENGTIWTKRISAIARHSVLNCPQPGNRSVCCLSVCQAISTGMRSTGARSVMTGRSRWSAAISKALSTSASRRQRSCSSMVLHLRPVDPAGKDQAPFQCQCRYLPIFHAPQAACQPEHQQHLQRPRRNNDRRYERLANDPGPQP